MDLAETLAVCALALATAASICSIATFARTRALQLLLRLGVDDSRDTAFYTARATLYAELVANALRRLTAHMVAIGNPAEFLPDSLTGDDIVDKAVLDARLSLFGSISVRTLWYASWAPITEPDSAGTIRGQRLDALVAQINTEVRPTDTDTDGPVVR